MVWCDGWSWKKSVIMCRTPARAAANTYANISAVQSSEKSACSHRLSQLPCVRFMRLVSEIHKSLILRRSSLRRRRRVRRSARAHELKKRAEREGG